MQITHKLIIEATHWLRFPGIDLTSFSTSKSFKSKKIFISIKNKMIMYQKVLHTQVLQVTI